MVTEKEAWKALKTIIDFCMQFTHEECRKLQCPISFWCDEIRVSRPVDWDEEIDFDQTITEAEEEGDRMTYEESPPEPERKWIPVSERLPEKDGYYFVTKRLIDGRIQTDIEHFWTGADWWKSEYHFAGISLWEVLAWQPLPEPYKAGDEE